MTGNFTTPRQMEGGKGDENILIPADTMVNDTSLSLLIPW